MRAISIDYDACLEILAGTKTKEYRTWKVKLGDILVCSTKSTTPSKASGLMICIVEVYAVKQDCGDLAWCLRNIRPVFQAKVSGKQGLWSVPDEHISLLGSSPALPIIAKPSTLPAKPATIAKDSEPISTPAPSFIDRARTFVDSAKVNQVSLDTALLAARSRLK